MGSVYVFFVLATSYPTLSIFFTAFILIDGIGGIFLSLTNCERLEGWVRQLTSGDVSVIEKLKSTLIHFELRFEMLPGTVPEGEQQFNRNPFQQDVPAVIGGA